MISCFFIIQSSKSRLNSEKICFSRFLSFIYILNSADLVMSERIEKLRIFSAFSKSVFGTSNFESFYFEIRKKLFKNWLEHEWKQLKRKKNGFKELKFIHWIFEALSFIFPMFQNCLHFSRNFSVISLNSAAPSKNLRDFLLKLQKSRDFNDSAQKILWVRRKKAKQLILRNDHDKRR